MKVHQKLNIHLVYCYNYQNSSMKLGARVQQSCLKFFAGGRHNVV